MRRKSPSRKGNALSLSDLATCGRCLTVDDLATIFRVNKLTIYRAAKAGRIPGCFKIAGCVRFDPRKVAQAFPIT